MISGLLLSTVSVIFYFDVLFWQILFLFGVLIVLSLASTIANRVWTSWHVDKDWYLAYQGMHTTSCNISQHLAASRNISQQLTTSLTKVTPSSSCWYQVKCYTCLYHVYVTAITQYQSKEISNLNQTVLSLVLWFKSNIVNLYTC